MKKIILASIVASTMLFASGHNHDNDANMINEFNPKSVEHIVVEMNMLDEKGDKKVGEVVAINTNYGVALFPNMSGLGEGGMHGFHIHVNADCGATEKGIQAIQKNTHLHGMTAVTRVIYQLFMLIKMELQITQF